MTDRELFEKIQNLVREDWVEMPDNLGGSGAPGVFLEQRLGLNNTNLDTPDAGRWELKYSSGTSLITLLHKTPQPPGSIRYMINRFGWTGRNQRQNFRHTIVGRSDRGFEIVANDGKIIVHHKDHDSNAPIPYWTQNTLLNAIGGKLRRLLIVSGEKKQRKVRYMSATAYTDFDITGFVQALTNGFVAVDFDAYIKDSGAIRDHGTKFRVHPKDVQYLYSKIEKIC